MIIHVGTVPFRVSRESQAFIDNLGGGLGVVDTVHHRFYLSEHCPSTNVLDTVLRLTSKAVRQLYGGIREADPDASFAQYVAPLIADLALHEGLRRLINLGTYDVCGPVPVSAMTKTLDGRTNPFPRECKCLSSIPVGRIAYGPERMDPTLNQLVCDCAAQCPGCEELIVWAELSRGFKRPVGGRIGDARVGTSDDLMAFQTAHPEKCQAYQVAG